MANDKSLINLGDLSKPATILIERVSDAVGGIFKPSQIKRIARAKAEANKIRALSQIEISEIEKRALERFVTEQGKKQENIESITMQAAQQLGDNSKPEDLDEDWITYFFEKCRIVSDTEMQGLWAKLLAGEATQHGTYSKRTVNFVSSLDKSDAALFTNLCTFAWQIDEISVLIFNYDHDIYQSHEINFNALNHLDDIGLITFETMPGFARKMLPKTIVVEYFGTPISLEFPKEKENEFELGQALFTSVGMELSPICGSTPSNEFLDYVVKKWVRENLCPYSPLPNDASSPTA
ncbi:MAG: DUF2806 domain-containing protein [Proteobacteria bacterium]|nr:DUF2806 domain-containing protein [Pseudomonadota bacterium]